MKKNSQNWRSKARLAKKQQEEPSAEEQIEILQQEIKKLQKKNLALQTENITLKSNLAEYVVKTKEIEASSSLLTNINLSDFNEKETWLNKLLFILRRADLPLQSKEISKLLASVDRKFRAEGDKSKVLSVHLNTAVKYERMRHHKVRGSGGYFFCLAEWFENDKLKKKYLLGILMQHKF